MRLGSLRLGRPYDWLWAILVLGIVIQSVRLFWTIVTPVAPLGDWRPAGVDVMQPEARSALLGSFDPFSRSGAAVTTVETSNVTSLSLTLYGIRLNQAAGGGSAIIADSEGEQVSYSVGEEIQPGVTLDGVAFDHVVLGRNGMQETLYMDQSVPATSVSPAPPPNLTGQVNSAGSQPAPPQEPVPPSPDAPPVPTSSLSPELIRKTVDFAPRRTDGRIDGIVVTSKGNDAAFRAAGFAPGDVITSFNGRTVSSAAEVAAMVQGIKPGARISVEVERGSRKVPIALIIPE